MRRVQFELGEKQNLFVVSANLHYIPHISCSTRQENSRLTILPSLTGSWDKLVYKDQVSLSTGLDFTLVPSADRANVVYRDLHGFRGGYFEVLFAFVVRLVSARNVLLVFRKNTFLRYPFNSTTSENGSRNCFGQKIRTNFDTGRAVELAHSPSLCLYCTQ